MRRRLLALGVLAILAGCTHLAETAPAAVNISGTWVAQQAGSPPPPSSAFDPNAIETTQAGTGDRTGEGVEAPPFLGATPRLSMLSAARMTIDQDATSMGIDYPDQPYRDVKWGTQQRGPFVVDAGWDDANRLIVRTSSRAMRVKEVYSLSSDANTLTLDIELSGRAMPTTHVVRTFAREKAAQ